MNALALWLRTPLSPQSSVRLWLILTVFVFVMWFVIPLLLGGFVESEFLAIRLSLRNLSVMMCVGFGEEMVFRVLPILIVFRLFPGKIVMALLASLVVALPFALWHERVYIATVFLWLGSAVLAVTCLKFGAASNKPFEALIACGSIHATCDFAAAAFANLVTF